MKPRSRVRRGSITENGFTLVELLVAIAILGIIMVAIGAMIATAFTTTATVGERLNSSRGPKMVSRYWVPDVESADPQLSSSATCDAGSGMQPLVTFAWNEYPSTITTPDADPLANERLHAVTWAYNPGTRNQVVRVSCLAGSPVQTTVVVADVARIPSVTTAGQVSTIEVIVPDKSEHNKTLTLTFSVGAHEAVTPSTPTT